jgi:hypothetical protein
MTTPDPEVRRRERKRRKSAVSKDKRCSRESCTRPKAEGNPYCTPLCRTIANEIDKAEALCRTAGADKLSTELWLSAVELNDALSKYSRYTARLRGLVRDMENCPREPERPPVVSHPRVSA